jgi:fructose-bisphosphate aldolase class II
LPSRESSSGLRGAPLTRSSWIARCHAAGVATEVELGRLEGGEAGLRVVVGTVFTDPKKAEAFMKE